MASPSFAPFSANHHRVSLAHIDLVVSACLGPTRGLGKSQPQCFNRQIAMYLASQVGRWSTTVIGRFYGGRDHSTVVHAIQRVQAMRDAEPELDALLCDLKSRVQAEATGTPEAKPQRLESRRPMTKETEIRMLAKEFATQVRDLVGEELRANLVRSLEGSADGS